MLTNSVWLIADNQSAAGTLEAVLDNLDHADGEMVLDFSSVRRLDTKAIEVMHRLTSKASAKSIKLVLRGVNVDIYKVLKLVKLAPAFTFLV